jgi:hypothetical protein
VFFGQPSPTSGEVEYCGTGFLVTCKIDGWGFGYLVTARHVAERVNPSNQSVVRVNTPDHSSAPVLVDDVHWTYHPDPNVDVAVTPCQLDQKTFDIGYYNLPDIVKRDASPYRVQCGDPICVIGLFHLHSGSQRNTPIVHSGNIALLPDPKEPIPVSNPGTGELLHMEAYLVEAQTLEGLSGAPVFQREIVSVRDLGEHNGGPALLETGAQLLGVYSAAWAGYPSPTVSDEKNLSPNRRVPIGMGIVVPSEKILELVMEGPDLKKSRLEFLKEKQAHLSIEQRSNREANNVIGAAE